jgi:peptidoglycan L-alanyl-D-glutamate endopeptidase CwlK
MVNSRLLSDLLPDVEQMCRSMIKDCQSAGIELIVTSTYRDYEAQLALFCQGRSTPGRIVTNAAAGYSWHNWRRAFDVVPVVGGKAIWDDDYMWRKCGDIGKKSGLEWAGEWVTFKEMPHFQFRGGHELQELLNANPGGLK